MTTSTTNSNENGEHIEMAETLALTPPVFAKGSSGVSYASDTLLAYVQDSNKDVGIDEDNVLALGRGLVDPFNHLEKDVEIWENLLKELFAVILHYVRQIPPKHPYQFKLIRLLQHIRSLPSPPEERIPEDLKRTYMKFWSSLPRFLDVYNKYQLFSPSYPPRAYSKVKLRLIQEANPDTYPQPRMLNDLEYTNLNAFVAELWTLNGEDIRTEFHQLDKTCLCAMIDALEEDLAPFQLNQLLPSAAAWIFGAGKRLRGYRLSRRAYTANPPDREPGTRWYYSKGKLWEGSRWFNHER
ncbi:MAG: hypothetical protein M1831_003538 [Alyxoria varia]|nr:MAG: hypothetical protein M1831_003538 [Alyxoria varia]